MHNQESAKQRRSLAGFGNREWLELCASQGREIWEEQAGSRDIELSSKSGILLPWQEGEVGIDETSSIEIGWLRVSIDA